MREDEMKRRVTSTLESRGGAFGALITGDGVCPPEKFEQASKYAFDKNSELMERLAQPQGAPPGTPMTYYLTADDNADPEGLRGELAARADLAEIAYVASHPYQEPDGDAYEGPSHLQDAFTDLARKYGYSLWV